MEITINISATSDEIAALVLAVQERQTKQQISWLLSEAGAKQSRDSDQFCCSACQERGVPCSDGDASVRVTEDVVTADGDMRVHGDNCSPKSH